MSVLSLTRPLSSRPVRMPELPLRNGADIPRHVLSSQLLPDGARELVIQHQGSEYHLRLTRNDKLILTK